jgi:hypothetical protein
MLALIVRETTDAPLSFDRLNISSMAFSWAKRIRSCTVRQPLGMNSGASGSVRFSGEIRSSTWRRWTAIGPRLSSAVLLGSLCASSAISPQIHLPFIRQQGDGLAVGDFRRGVAGVHKGRNIEFAGHRGQVAGNSAQIGDDSAHPPHQGCQIRRSCPGHEDSVFRCFRGQPGRNVNRFSGHLPGRGGLAAGKQQFQILPCHGTDGEAVPAIPRGRDWRKTICPCSFSAHSISWGDPKCASSFSPNRARSITVEAAMAACGSCSSTAPSFPWILCWMISSFSRSILKTSGDAEPPTTCSPSPVAASIRACPADGREGSTVYKTPLARACIMVTAATAMGVAASVSP